MSTVAVQNNNNYKRRYYKRTRRYWQYINNLKYNILDVKCELSIHIFFPNENGNVHFSLNTSNNNIQWEQVGRLINECNSFTRYKEAFAQVKLKGIKFVITGMSRDSNLDTPNCVYLGYCFDNDIQNELYDKIKNSNNTRNLDPIGKTTWYARVNDSYKRCADINSDALGSIGVTCDYSGRILSAPKFVGNIIFYLRFRNTNI